MLSPAPPSWSVLTFLVFTVCCHRNLFMEWLFLYWCQTATVSFHDMATSRLFRNSHLPSFPWLLLVFCDRQLPVSSMTRFLQSAVIHNLSLSCGTGATTGTVQQRALSRAHFSHNLVVGQNKRSAPSVVLWLKRTTVALYSKMGGGVIFSIYLSTKHHPPSVQGPIQC